LEIEYIRLAHDRGLGVGDTDQVEIVGIGKGEFERLNFGFKVEKSPIIKWDQILRRRTASVRWLHRLLFHSHLFKAFIFSSKFYHDWFWYPLIGKERIRAFIGTDWGALFERYEYGEFPKYRDVRDWDPY